MKLRTAILISLSAVCASLIVPCMIVFALATDGDPHNYLHASYASCAAFGKWSGHYHHHRCD